jgi:hypothetical protein
MQAETNSSLSVRTDHTRRPMHGRTGRCLVAPSSAGNPLVCPIVQAPHLADGHPAHYSFDMRGSTRAAQVFCGQYGATRVVGDSGQTEHRSTDHRPTDRKADCGWSAVSCCSSVGLPMKLLDAAAAGRIADRAGDKCDTIKEDHSSCTPVYTIGVCACVCVCTSIRA